METCPMCEETKDKNQFYYEKSGKRQAYCKPCNLINTQQRQRKFKYDCVQYKGGKCVMCGYNKCLNAMEFHHRDPNEKDFGISQLKFTSFEKNPRVKEELDKCDLVCANCHREIHEKLVYFDKNKVVLSSTSHICECGKTKQRTSIRCVDCRTNKLSKLIDSGTFTEKMSLCECGRSKSKTAIKCESCHSKHMKTKIQWPTSEVLAKLVWEKPTSEIAKELGVSDKAIANKCKKYGIKKPKRGYWSIGVKKEYLKSRKSYLCNCGNAIRKRNKRCRDCFAGRTNKSK